MSVKDIAKLGKLLAQSLAGFAGCFARSEGRSLLKVYVQGLLSDVQRKNVEAIALDQSVWHLELCNGFLNPLSGMNRNCGGVALVGGFGGSDLL